MAKLLLINRLVFIAFAVIFASANLFAQPIGGPYTPDDNTMLLLHFDGNLNNVSGKSDNGVFHGDASNFFFLNNPIAGMGQCLRIDNDSQNDRAYVTVADNNNLDLIGDWTIEGWINIFTFGEGADDWRWVPRLVIKTGDQAFWQPNYFVEMWGSTRFFSCGYHTNSQDAWPQANSPTNTFVPGQWYHMAFIRDTSRHLLLTIIHNASREMIAFSVADYLTFGAADPTPIVTNQPVHIGYAGGGEDSFLDGFVDEIRISNVVREYAIPPIISTATVLSNQTSDVPYYEVGANIYTLFSTTIASAKLYYDTGTGWQSVNMTTVAGDSMAGKIPKQPSGTIVKYYLEAIDNLGQAFVFPRDAGRAAAEYYSFGIYTPGTMTLGLDFEEGSGVPQDASEYNNQVTMVGKPAFWPGAPEGTYCLSFDGDSSYLSIDSPFLSAEEFCVDFWFNTDRIENYCRILNKANTENIWYDNNYQIRFNDVQQLQAISDGSVTFTTDFTVQIGTWYHVVYEVQKAPASDTSAYYGAFQVKNESGQELFFAYLGFDKPVILAGGPLRIGKAAFGDYPPYFMGFIDAVKIYNYAAVGLMNKIFYPETLGGPYEPDDNTMLLMHFDGNLTNVSGKSDNGQFHGDASNFFFLNNPIAGMGQCLRIDNDSQADKAFVTVADNDNLDLTGDWTIEGWINIFTFGEGPADWRWVPRLVIKTGDEVFWRPNYFVEMWGSTRFFSCGYHTASEDQWPQANSPNNTFVPGEWYHMAFIRDTARHLLLTIISNSDRELVAFSAMDYLSFGALDPTPIITSQPLHIGYAGGGEDSYLDGFVDEIRISNVIRQFPVPPVVTNVTQLPNQSSDSPSYVVSANVFTLFASAIQSAILYYNTGTGWQSVPMVTVSGDSMVGAIPKQSTGSIIDYYVKAIDNTGLSYTQPLNAETEGVYFSFGIYTPMTQTLGLGFEEGSGTPQDASPYHHMVTVAGIPAFSSDAVVGSHSLYLEGDSSYLSVDSPFLSAEEFCVDFWFKTERIENYCRILNRANTENIWYDNNYQIRFNDIKQLQAISDGSVTFTTTDTIKLNKWYHVIYEVQKAPAKDTSAYYGAFKVMDENGTELFFAYQGFNKPVILAGGPLRIGKAAFGDYPPYFKGYFDAVNIYNYAAVGLLKGIVSVQPTAGMPLEFELSQNYPNPFNPTTEIQYSIPYQQNVTLAVYNLLGKKVKTLVARVVPAGYHVITWDGTNDLGLKVSSGVYFYRLESKDKIKVRKMLLLK